MCDHELETVTYGCWHFSGGDAWDDIREVVYCKKCNQVLYCRHYDRQPQFDESGSLTGYYCHDCNMFISIAEIEASGQSFPVIDLLPHPVSVLELVDDLPV